MQSVGIQPTFRGNASIFRVEVYTKKGNFICYQLHAGFLRNLRLLRRMFGSKRDEIIRR
jgi:hypothetical protein